jgi:hypothetical protein
VGGAPATCGPKLHGKIGDAGQSGIFVAKCDRLDHRDDSLAMRDQPASQRVQHASNDRGTDDRRRHSQQHRAAEGVRE